MSEYKVDEKITHFIERLNRLEPGERARLKRNAGRKIAEAREATTLFYRLLPHGVPIYQEEAFFLVATLFGMAEEAKSGDFGASLQKARKAKQNEKGLDRRVEALLDTNMEQLPFRLRQAVHFLQSNRIAVNWTILLDDLLRWNHPDRIVQRRWARSYFGSEIHAVEVRPV